MIHPHPHDAHQIKRNIIIPHSNYSSYLKFASSITTRARHYNRCDQITLMLGNSVLTRFLLRFYVTYGTKGNVH